MDNKIYDYIIVGDSNINMLTQKVKEKILEGWQPFGSLSTCVQGTKVWIFQTLIKR